MRRTTCKCGEMEYIYSGMRIPKCEVCEKCGTTFGGEKPEPHEWKIQYNQNTGEPYELCMVCYKKRKITN